MSGTCEFCNRDLFQSFHIELAYIDDINPMMSHVETYCSSKCLKEVMK